jgi:hypothetical protein
MLTGMEFPYRSLPSPARHRKRECSACGQNWVILSLGVPIGLGLVTRLRSLVRKTNVVEKSIEVNWDVAECGL